MNRADHPAAPAPSAALSSPAERARFVLDRLPAGGLFAGQEWRTATGPFPLDPGTAREIESMGRVLLQFYRACNLLYRQSVQGRQPAWIAGWLDQGKPKAIIDLQRSTAFKNEIPRVIRPDLLLTDDGLGITELDSVPGGIGLTAWLNQTYAAFPPAQDLPAAAGSLGAAPSRTGSARARVPQETPPGIIGGGAGMLQGFASIFGEAPHVHLVVSEESETYRPEMEWLAEHLGAGRFAVRDARFTGFGAGDAAYRFFELFDLANVANSSLLFERATAGQLRLTPPPKAFLEEKMLLALLWNRHLQGFWRQELGGGFLRRMLEWVPYTWVVDPAPMPPHAAVPELNLTDWRQLRDLSQRERELILKVSGYSDQAWGARGVYLGSDLSATDWATAVDRALDAFSQSPYILQRYRKARLVETEWFDFDREQAVRMEGRVRLCPYYFVHGDGDEARARLGGVLATICPADKKIIHGMREAVLAPASA